MPQQDSDKLKKIEMMMARSKSRFEDDEQGYVEVPNSSPESENVRGCYGLESISSINNNNNINIEKAVFALNPVTPLTSPNTWDGWYALHYGAEMGDAWEPTTEDILTRAGFALTPAEVIPPEQVLKAAEYIRMSGDRQSTLAMMTPTNVNGWVWSVDPTTNKWVTHAKFR